MSISSARCPVFDSLVLQAVAAADSAGARGLQMEQRVAGAGLD